MGGCIPVIISDSVVLPFENLLDWSEFSVKMLAADAVKPNFLKQRLESISANRTREMLRSLDRARHKLTFHEPPEAGDAYEMTIEALRASLRPVPRSPAAWTSY